MISFLLMSFAKILVINVDNCPTENEYGHKWIIPIIFITGNRDEDRIG